MAELDGSRVVVVGASSGIGRAVAELAGRSGARVLGLSRTGASPEGATGISADARDDTQVSAALARIDRIDHLVFTAGAPQGSPRVSEIDGDALQLLAFVANEAVTLLGGTDRGRLRKCGNEGCAILFVDLSRSGARRWCSMAACGNRHKVAEFRRRRS